LAAVNEPSATRGIDAIALSRAWESTLHPERVLPDGRPILVASPDDEGARPFESPPLVP